MKRTALLAMLTITGCAGVAPGRDASTSDALGDIPVDTADGGTDATEDVSFKQCGTVDAATEAGMFVSIAAPFGPDTFEGMAFRCSRYVPDTELVCVGTGTTTSGTSRGWNLTMRLRVSNLEQLTPTTPGVAYGSLQAATLGRTCGIFGYTPAAAVEDADLLTMTAEFPPRAFLSTSVRDIILNGTFCQRVDPGRCSGAGGMVALRNLHLTLAPGQ